MGEQIGADVLDRLRRTPTGEIVDAMAMANLKGAVFGIGPSRGYEDVRIAGPALTIKYAPASGHGAVPKTVYDIFYESAPGQIVVIDGGGAEYSFTGDNQAHTAKRAGMEGIVIDGYSRDVAGIRALGLPLYVKGPTSRVQIGIYDLVGYDVPVQIGGVAVNPGDVIVGDEDGIVVIPREKLGIVLENLNVVDEIEEKLEALIEDRRPVDEIKAQLARKKPRA